jgi:hypothetical protein
MGKKKVLTTVAMTICDLEKQRAAKQEALASVKKEIEAIYREGILGGQIDEVLRKTLEKKNVQLPYEIATLEGMIEEARTEALDLAQAEIDKIPEEITAQQAMFIKERENILPKFMEALERVSLLHWRLNGVSFRIPRTGDLVLPPLPFETVTASNERLKTLFEGPHTPSDPYAITLKIQELKGKQSRGARALAEEALANAR